MPISRGRLTPRRAPVSRANSGALTRPACLIWECDRGLIQTFGGRAEGSGVERALRFCFDRHLYRRADALI
jgi:hypothetical protein